MRRWLAVAALAVLLAALGGCGSSALSSSQLHTAATRICSGAARRTDRIAAPASPGQTQAFLKRGIASLTPELTQLRALRPPGEVSDVYRATVQDFAQQLGDLRIAMHDLGSGEDPVIALKTLQHRLAPLESDENGGWQALQLPACLAR